MTTLKISIQTYRIFYLTQRLFAKHHTFSDAHADSYPHRGTKGVGGGGGWMEPLPGVFDMLQYFETTLPSVESL